MDVFVSKDTLSRALEAATELFLELEDRGHDVCYAPRGQHFLRPDVDARLEGGRERFHHRSWSPARPTIVYVGTVAYGLTLYELSEEVEVRYHKGEYVRADQIPTPKRRAGHLTYDWTHKKDLPSGRLCLRASSPYPRATWERQWRESNPGDLPNKFPRIAKVLEAEAGTLAKLVEEGERQAEIERLQWEEQRRRWQREEEERRRTRNIKESREELLSIVEAWGVAKGIEGFFEDAEQRTEGLDASSRQVILDRLQRARALLGGVDALDRFRAWKSPEER